MIFTKEDRNRLLQTIAYDYYYALALTRVDATVFTIMTNQEIIEVQVLDQLQCLVVSF